MSIVQLFTGPGGLDGQLEPLLLRELLDAPHTFLDQRQLIAVDRHHQQMAFVAEHNRNRLATAECSNQLLEIRRIETLHSLHSSNKKSCLRRYSGPDSALAV